MPRGAEVGVGGSDSVGKAGFRCMSASLKSSCMAPIPKPAWGPESGPQLREQWGQMLLEAEPPAPMSVLCLLPCSGVVQDKRQDIQEHQEERREGEGGRARGRCVERLLQPQGPPALPADCAQGGQLLTIHEGTFVIYKLFSPGFLP